jgi:sterol desaturase/sphingolipid hydroxylase (fatty acid hydroxylase superfamily)
MRKDTGEEDMPIFVIEHETALRLGFFFGVFAVMALWEVMAPKRELTSPKALRWTNNLAVTFLNTALLRILLPVTAVWVAVWAHRQGIGLFNALPVPEVTAGVLSVAILDLAIYTQHVVFHHVPLLWRLHMMHHLDLDIDVTTGARFHPIEILLSMGIKMAVILAMGPPAWAVVVFEVLLNATAMFNHSNVALPGSLDRVLRLVIVTPDMHRVHHSVIRRETNSNFGFNLPWWDRLFGTYRAQPVKGHMGMRIGMANFRQQSRVNLPRMLTLPFTAPRDLIL